ncbi:MAG: hypothetical protein M3P39_06155 [Actinomycetota bacterium]|nr:hypothetical protein [Actinomycetota bacterium]
MPEHHDICGPPRGEPLRRGRRGIRVRVPLTGAPTCHWARCLSAQLALRLTGERSGRDLTLAELVRGSDVVLDGVHDEAESRQLGSVLRDAVAATNDAAVRAERAAEPCNTSQEDADRIAGALGSGVRTGAEEREPVAGLAPR